MAETPSTHNIGTINRDALSADKLWAENEIILKRELGYLGVIARALVATLLDATGKGDETAIIFSTEDLQRASQLELEYQPLEDGTLALIMSGMTKQKEAAREDQADV